MPDFLPGSVWVLSDDRPGNRHQALAIAERLSADVTLKTLTFNRLVTLPNRLIGPRLLTLTTDAKHLLAPPFPTVIISVGRRAAPAAAWIRRSHPATFTVHLMRPELPANLFDLIVLPSHDRAFRGDNIIHALGSASHLTPEALTAAGEALRPSITLLHAPFIGLLVGGRNKAGDISADQARALGEQASALAQAKGAAILATTSRRTSPQAAQALAGALQVPHLLYHWGDGEANPYPGLLELAQSLIVTGDSTAMVSECCSTGKEVLVADAIGSVGPKQRRFLDAIYGNHHARPLSAALLPYDRLPVRLDTAGLIADTIRQRLEAQRY